MKEMEMMLWGHITMMT